MKMLVCSSVLVVLALLMSTCATIAHAEEQRSSCRHSAPFGYRCFCDFGLYNRANNAIRSTTSGSGWAGELGLAGGSYHMANSASRVAIRNMPLQSAIVIAAKTGTKKVLVSQTAKEIIHTSDKMVSVQSRDKSQEQLLRLVLRGTSLRLAKIDNTLQLFTDGEESKQVEFSPIGRLAVEHALARHLPLDMDHAPIEVALGMVQGFTGLRITYGSSDDWSWMGGPLITIHSNGRAVSEVLEDLARQVDCELKVLDDRIELRKRG